MEDQITAYSLDSSLSCDEAKQIFLDGSYTSYDQMIEVSAKVEQCKLTEYNAKIPNDPVISTMSIDNNGDNPKVLFNTIRLKEAEKVADISKVLITIGAAAKFNGDPELITIVSEMGSLSVDAYLDAAKKNDPLIIFLPQAVPTLKVGKDVFKAITEGKIVDKVEITIQDGVDYIKQHPSLLLAGTTDAVLNGIKLIAPKTIVASIDKAEGKVTGLIVDGTEMVYDGGKMITKVALDAHKKAIEVAADAAKAAAGAGKVIVEEAIELAKKLNPFD